MSSLSFTLSSGDGAATALPEVERRGRAYSPSPRRPASAVPSDPFRLFVETHQRALYALAYRLAGDHAAADDLVQETFVKAWTAMQAGTTPDVPEAWLRRIAVRQFLNTQRGSFAQRVVRWTDEMLHRLPDPAPAASEPTFAAAFQRALARLSERERAAFVLRHVEDRSTKDTADTLGVAEGTVKALLSRAVAKMQTALQPYA